VYYNLILQVGSYVSEKTAAGGHQGYAALGGLYTQARPMCPHVYGPLHVQESMIPVRLIQLPYDHGHDGPCPLLIYQIFKIYSYMI
jgi:hypothetical protein